MNSPSDSGSVLHRVFGRSPFGPLFRHIEIVDAAATNLAAFFDAAGRDDWTRAGALHDEIVEQERAADTIKEEIRLHLPRRLWLPISRGDLLELIEAQDKIINRIKDISGLMLGRRMIFPAGLRVDMQRLVETAIAAVTQCGSLLGEFQQLLESGFGDRATQLVADSVARLGALETRADEEEMALRDALLAIEAELAPLEAMFLYRVIDWIGTLADRAERAGTRLQILVSH